MMISNIMLNKHKISSERKKSNKKTREFKNQIINCLKQSNNRLGRVIIS